MLGILTERGLSSELITGLKYQDCPAEEPPIDFEARLKHVLATGATGTHVIIINPTTTRSYWLPTMADDRGATHDGILTERGLSFDFIPLSPFPSSSLLA